MPLAKRCTIVLVTHQTHFLSECDQIFLMEDGSIVSSGKPADFLAEMQELGKQYLNDEDKTAI